VEGIEEMVLTGKRLISIPIPIYDPGGKQITDERLRRVGLIDAWPRSGDD